MATQTKPKISKKDLEQKRATIEAAIRKKRECEKKALEIVEHLVENKVTNSNWLLEHSRYINPQYYQDVTEERAITKICGYPLCPNLLGNVQNKKFAISTKTNKVYDISERKKFCSDKCFSASKNFKDQLPTSPLWMRDEEIFAKIEIPETIKCLPGDEVLITSVVLPDDEKEEDSATSPDQTKKKTDKQKGEQKGREVREENAITRPHPCDVVFNSLCHWFCPRTLDWLENISELSDDEVDDLSEIMSELKVNKSCKEGETKAEYKGAISYDVLKRDKKHSQLKVRAFFSGRWEYACEEDDELEPVEEESKDLDPDAVEVPIVMPLANLSAQKALRRNVVFNYLENWFMSLAMTTNLKLRQFQGDLQNLISTFNLTADTITFRPDEMPILGVTVLLIIGKKNATVREILLDPMLQQKLAKILQPYDRSLSDLGEFLEHLVEKCKENKSRLK